MATMEVITTSNDKFHELFEYLEAQKTLLTKCNHLYKALTSHFTSLQNSIDSKTLTLDSKLQFLDSNHQQSLTDLDNRENSLPDRLNSMSLEIEEKQQSAIDEVQKRVDTSAPLAEALKSICRRMDHGRLVRFLVGKRKEMTSRDDMADALKECVDPARMVLETVKEFVEAKETAKRIPDKRWACGVVVSGLFSPEELKEKGIRKRKVVEFSRKTMAEAEAVVRDWRERAEKDGGGNEGKLGSAEAAMFLQVVVGFGLREIFEEEFYEKVAMDFSGRRDMAMLAVPIFGDKLPDFIDQLIKNGKEVEAVYFASESGLTERFQPASLLKSFLHNSRKNTTEILKKGNYNASATEEANNFEMSYIRSIIKCVDDHKLEVEFSVNSLKKRLSILEKTKVDKKNRSTTISKPSNKRAHCSGGPSRRAGGPPPRPVKRTKYPSYGNRETVPRVMSPVSRYLGPYSLSGQTVYDPALTASTYGQRYGASLVPSVDQVTQQHYGASAVSAPSPSTGPRLNSYVVPGGSVPSPGAGYGLQSTYGVYDYGATTTTSTYQPPPYVP